MFRRLSILAILCLITGSVFADINPDLLAGMKARSIGPASMSGRVAAVAVVESNTDIIYVGAATGGVWKSMNAGLTWNPIFDDQPVAAIGAVAVYQPNPDIVWVGTGEGNPRNSASVGNGVYKSMDGGKKWTHIGLEGTERIHRILLHPSNPNVAYAASMGREWGENPERGVFKTEDGGHSWKKLLYVNERVGCADLVMDPSNPQKLIAAMWEYRRWPWFFNSGGPYSGLFISNDGGENWGKLTEEDGLPKGNLGRIGVAFSRSNTQIVYALVEAEKSALVRSRDGGKTWSKINEEPNVSSRPFYYADIRVDPELSDRIYSLAGTLNVSEDAGKSFAVLTQFRDVHPDHHDLWINPKDGSHMILGNDGGVSFSYDRGATWRFVPNLPLAQYYHVNVDMDTPYNVYGGLQDNGSWRGPSQVWENGAIRNHHWQEIGFGDGFDVVPDRKDSLIGYSMSQEGYVRRWNLHTGEQKDIRPFSGPQGEKLRFNWNAGIAMDEVDGSAIYFGSQFLHKSTDRGETWTVISPDLTTNNPEWQKQDKTGGLTLDVTGAENFTTIIAIAPSPLQHEIIWVGSDDGRVHVTTDGGNSWNSVEKNIKGVPENTWVPQIRASRKDPASAFIVFDDHRRSNWTPYVYRTSDYGKSWTNLATKDIKGYALSIEQDIVNPELLFLGTEFGMHISLNGGKKWFKWTHGFPTVSTMDMVIHPRDQDLVIATHGRALYILDDIRPLRTLSEETMSKPIHVFEPPDAQLYQVKQTGGERFAGNTEFRGANRPYGALITFSLNFEGLPLPDTEKEKERKEKERQVKLSKPPATDPEQKKEDMPQPEPPKEGEEGPQVEIKISDAQGKVIRTFKSPARMGLNRAVWDMNTDAFREPPRAGEPRPFREPSGPEVLPGVYNVSISYKDQTAKTSVKVVADPRYQISDQDRQAKWDAIQRGKQIQEKTAVVIERVIATNADIGFILERVGKLDKDEKKESGAKESSYKALLDSAGKLKKELAELEKKLWTPPKTKGIVAETDVWSKMEYAIQSMRSSKDAPTAAQLGYLQDAEKSLAAVQLDVDKFYSEKLPELRKMVEEKKILLLAP